MMNTDDDDINSIEGLGKRGRPTQRKDSKNSDMSIESNKMR